MSIRCSCALELEQGGCQVEFVDRPMSQDPHDQLLLQIRGAVAEYERSLIAERMRRGRRQKYQAGGLLPWTRPPYGYRVDPARPRDVAGGGGGGPGNAGGGGPLCPHLVAEPD